MKGRIIVVDRYHREDLRGHPNALFVFGDNFAGIGRGGQARECRGEPNAVGIVTKWHPTMDDGAFLTNDALPRIRYRYQDDFRRLAAHLNSGGDVFWPADGVGTGLAQLPRRAPEISAYIGRCFKHLSALAAGSRRAKTPKAVECEASQSGPKGNAHTPPPSETNDD